MLGSSPLIGFSGLTVEISAAFQYQKRLRLNLPTGFPGDWYYIFVQPLLSICPEHHHHCNKQHASAQIVFPQQSSAGLRHIFLLDILSPPPPVDGTPTSPNRTRPKRKPQRQSTQPSKPTTAPSSPIRARSPKMSSSPPPAALCLAKPL